MNSLIHSVSTGCMMLTVSKEFQNHADRMKNYTAVKMLRC